MGIEDKKAFEQRQENFWFVKKIKNYKTLILGTNPVNSYNFRPTPARFKKFEKWPTRITNSNHIDFAIPNAGRGNRLNITAFNSSAIVCESTR